MSFAHRFVKNAFRIFMYAFVHSGSLFVFSCLAPKYLVFEEAYRTLLPFTVWEIVSLQTQLKPINYCSIRSGF
jgi:hypothetical protein